MATVPTPGYHAFWTNARQTFKAEFQHLAKQHPDAEEQLRQLFKVLSDIEDVAGYSQKSIGESQEWANIVSTIEDNRASYCKALSGKPLYSALYGSYTVTLTELKGLLKASVRTQESGPTNSSGPACQPEEGLKEVRRCKRQNSQETTETEKKAATLLTAKSGPKEVHTRNFFAPLRTETDVERTPVEETSDGPIQSSQQASSRKQDRPLPIVLTSTTNLIQLQRQIKGIAAGNFEFRDTRSGTRIVLKKWQIFQP
jgi:hypothetical protein